MIGGGHSQVAGGGPRWQVAGLFHSALYSVLNAVLHSALSLVTLAPVSTGQLFNRPHLRLQNDFL
jgi:hypothetical protein